MSGNGVRIGTVYDLLQRSKQSAESPRRNPQGPDTGERRVLRGGTWYRDAHTLRNAERVSDFPDTSLNVVGFRCAMDVALKKPSFSYNIIKTKTLFSLSSLKQEDIGI